MRNNLAYHLLALGISCAWACGDTNEPAAASDAAQSNPDAATAQEADKDAEAPSVPQPSAAGSKADSPAQPSADPASETADTHQARYPDACEERRGSWSKPCSADLDPCGLNSGYPGDEYCLKAPPEGQGIQIHFGPKDYKNADEVAKYLLQPGEEHNSYAIVNVPTSQDRWYSYVKISMRPGSHHLINNLMAGHRDEGFLDGRAGCDGDMLGSFPGTQNLIVESPPQGIPAPENEGLGRALPANASLCQNYHRYNNTEAPTLSEIWYNIWFAQEQDITQKTEGVVVTAGPWTPIQPHSQEVLTATQTVKGAGRIISLFGHRHAATERFAAWLNDDLIYDSWDWVESRLFNYDSLTENPQASPDRRSDGAVSGVLNVKNGDEIRIECHVNNTTDHALAFRNELYTGEMCILFGSTVGVGIYNADPSKVQ